MTLTRIDDIMNHYSINVNDRAPRPVRMNIATWKSLSDSDQKSWDNVTEDGKSKILDYNVQRAARSRSGPPHNGQRRQTQTNLLQDSTSRLTMIHQSLKLVLTI
jgi:hypothetical protein